MDCVCDCMYNIHSMDIKMNKAAALILAIGASQMCYFLFQAAAFMFEQKWPWESISGSVVGDVFGGFLIFLGCGVLAGALHQIGVILHYDRSIK